MFIEMTGTGYLVLLFAILIFLIFLFLYSKFKELARKQKRKYSVEGRGEIKRDRAVQKGYKHTVSSSKPDKKPKN